MWTYWRRGFDYALVGQLLPLGTAAWLVAKLSGGRYAVFLHGYDLNAALSRGRKRWLARLILSGADKILAANSHTAAQVAQWLPQQAAKVAVFNPGIDLEAWQPDAEAAAELKRRYHLTGPVLLSVGRLVERKGFAEVISQLPRWLKQHPELRYVIVGRGQQEQALHALAQKLGVAQQVLILTEVSDQEKALWYQAADIFVMCAKQLGADMEGFGIVYLEAGLAGKPVVAARVGGVADAVEDGVTGLLTDGSPEALRRAVERLLAEPQLAAKLGEQGRRRVQAFSWQAQAAKIIKFIHGQSL
jgi:phosphatidylinositol alpha-1,6-mannosyltransferase